MKKHLLKIKFSRNLVELNLMLALILLVKIQLELINSLFKLKK